MTDPQTIIAAAGAPNLAVDVLTDTGGRGDFVLDVSELDGPDLLGYGPAGWLNVVCDVTRVHLTRGATRLQGVLTRTEAGSCTIVARDTDRRLDPMVNGDAVHRGTAVRVRAWGGVDPSAPEWSAVLFTGRIADLRATYDPEAPPTVTIRANDLIGSTLAPWGSVGRDDPGVGADDTLLARVQRVLTELGQDPAALIAADSDAAYLATLAPSNLAAGWGDITDAADAELGQVWVNAADQLVVRSRGAELSGPVRGTLSDWHGEAVDADELHCCYTDPAVVYGAEQLANRVVGARRIPDTGASPPPTSALVQLIDEYSVARYGPALVDRRDLELASDDQLAPWAGAVILNATEPDLRVDSVSPAPWTASPEAWRAVCETDIGDRWAFRLHPRIGPTVARTVGVLGIEHDIAPDGWAITWATADAPTPGDANPSGWFVLDVSSLDEGDLLAPYPAPVP